MLTLAQQFSAIFTGLSDGQKVEASGHFSSVSNPAPNDLNHLLSYLDPNVTCFTRQIILTGPSCAALLYYEDKQFQILSAPSMIAGPDNTAFIVGHDGDSLAHTTPISIQASTAVLNVLALAFPPTEGTGTAALVDLMATHKIANNLPNDEDENEPNFTFPFPPKDTEDPAIIFARARVARIPSLLPLPMGHGLDPVSLANEEGIVNLITKLQTISPIYAEWAKSIFCISKYFGGKSLGTESLDVPLAYFESIDFTALLRGSINTKLSCVNVTSPEEKAIFTRIEMAKKSQH
jgi:hypothetical protein